MGDRRSTGIEHLDRQIGGGLAPGSVVGFRTPPESQGELLLRELATANESLYLSTTRTDDAVREWLGAADGIDIHYAGSDGLAPRSGDVVRDRLADAAGWTAVYDDRHGSDERIRIEGVTAAATSIEDGCVVVDPVNPLEQYDESTYTGFLHELQDHLIETDSVAFLHMVETPEPPNARWLTLQMADEVWQVSVDAEDDSVDFRLTVTKSRSGDVPRERIKLVLDDDVSIDTSRDIA